MVASASATILLTACTPIQTPPELVIRKVHVIQTEHFNRVMAEFSHGELKGNYFCAQPPDVWRVHALNLYGDDFGSWFIRGKDGDNDADSVMVKNLPLWERILYGQGYFIRETGPERTFQKADSFLDEYLPLMEENSIDCSVLD